MGSIGREYEFFYNSDDFFEEMPRYGVHWNLPPHHPFKIPNIIFRIMSLAITPICYLAIFRWYPKKKCSISEFLGWSLMQLCRKALFPSLTHVLQSKYLIRYGHGLRTNSTLQSSWWVTHILLFSMSRLIF